MTADLRAHLLKLETSLVEQPTRSSRPHLESLLAPAPLEFFEFTTGGRRIARAEIIDALVSQPPSVWTIDDFQLHPLAPSLALVTFRTTRAAADGAGGRTTTSLRSSIWRNDGDAWRLIFHQGTPAE